MQTRLASGRPTAQQAHQITSPSPTTPTTPPTGAPASQRSRVWEELGGFSGPMIPPLQSLTGAIIGFGGSGKSTLLQGMPDAYILNLDKSSTTNPNPRAVMWPGIRPEDGVLIDSDGKPMVLTWEHVAKKIEVLKRLAVENRPRPKTVVIDSMSAMIRLLMDWIPLHASELNVGSTDPTGNWNALDGRRSWDYLHRTTASVINQLHSHGYGVFVTLHLRHEVVPLSESQSVIRSAFTITDSHWGKIADIFAFVAAIAQETVSRSVPVVHTVTTSAGKTVQAKSTRIVQETVFRMAIDGKAVGLGEGMTKHRLPLPPTIDLPLENGWDHLSRIWDDARQRFLTGDPTPPTPSTPPTQPALDAAPDTVPDTVQVQDSDVNPR